VADRIGVVGALAAAAVGFLDLLAIAPGTPAVLHRDLAHVASRSPGRTR
jgi:hypothetical protein